MMSKFKLPILLITMFLILGCSSKSLNTSSQEYKVQSSKSSNLKYQEIITTKTSEFPECAQIGVFDSLQTIDLYGPSISPRYRLNAYYINSEVKLFSYIIDIKDEGLNKCSESFQIETDNEIRSILSSIWHYNEKENKRNSFTFDGFGGNFFKKYYGKDVIYHLSFSNPSKQSHPNLFVTLNQLDSWIIKKLPEGESLEFFKSLP